jgi:hypothetical protein
MGMTAVVIILLILGILVGAIFHSADSINGPEVASIWTSVVLTLFLAYIYSKQNDILAMQSRIMSGSHTPILSVSEFSFTDQEPKSGNALQISNGGEFLTFSVRNEGNDIAAGLSILYIPTFSLHKDIKTGPEIETLERTTFDQFPPEEATIPLIDHSVPPHLAREFPVYSTTVKTEASDIDGATVPTEGGANEMYAQAGFYVLEDNQRKPIGFARGIRQILKDDPIKSVIVGRILTYQNPFEQFSYVVLPALRFDEESSAAMADNPFDAVIESQENYYTNPDYREQIRQCAEAHLRGENIMYFEAE